MNTNLLFFCCFFAFSSVVLSDWSIAPNSDYTFYTNSLNYNQADLLAEAQAGRLKRRDPTVAWLNVKVGEIPPQTNDSNNNPIPDWFASTSHQISVFYPIIDEFSSLSLSVHDNATNTSAPLRWEAEDNVYIWLNVSGYYTPPRYYKNANNALFVGALVAVVSITEGNITGVSWEDDTCKDCDVTRCVGTVPASNCGFFYEELNWCADRNTTESSSKDIDPTMCDLKVYLAWVGTDRSKMNMRSYSYVPSQFSAYSALGVWQTAAGSASDSYFPEDEYS